MAATDEKLDKMSEDVTKILVMVARMDERMKSSEDRNAQAGKRLDNHEERIDCLEKKPVRWWNIGVAAFITSIITTLIAWIARNN